MSENSESLPPWLLSSRKDIKKTKRYWESIYAEGQDDIRRGLEVSKVARERLEELNYVDRILGQSIPTDLWNDELVGVTGTHLASTLCTYEQVSQQIAGSYVDFGRVKQTYHDELYNTASHTGTTAGSALYLSAQIERRFESQVSNYTLVMNTVSPETVGSRDETFRRLGEILRSFDPKYINMLEGSEEALQKDGPDHLSQAAHSMRDLFQQIIEDLAPSEAVKQQPWFEPTSGSPTGVSRRSRLRHILYGSGAYFDEADIRQLDEAATTAKTALDLCIARAHDHDPELRTIEVELAIDHARFALLQVLKRYVGN